MKGDHQGEVSFFLQHESGFTEEGSLFFDGCSVAVLDAEN